MDPIPLNRVFCGINFNGPAKKNLDIPIELVSMLTANESMARMWDNSNILLGAPISVFGKNASVAIIIAKEMWVWNEIYFYAFLLFYIMFCTI